jgi:hypothetical protein
MVGTVVEDMPAHYLSPVTIFFFFEEI